MSQGFHQGIFSFSHGFERAASTSQDEHQVQQQHIAQQSRRDKLSVQGTFDPQSHHHSLVSIHQGEDPDESTGIYETATGPTGNMLSDMFNFPGPSTTDLLASQMQQGGYRLPTRPVGPPTMVGFSGGDWYNSNNNNSSTSNLGSIGDSKHQLNPDSAAAMQLFLMNPPPPQPQQQQPRSPSPPPHPHHHPHPHPHHHHHHQSFQTAGGPFVHEAAATAGGGGSYSEGGVVEGQGLSLSLSSSLQQFEMRKADQELRVRDGVLYFNNNHHPQNSPQQQQQQQQQQQNPAVSLHLQGQQSQGPFGQGQHVHMGYSPVGVVNVLRNSSYSRAAQELLEEFCSVGRGQFKSSRIGRHHASSSSNPNPKNPAAAAASTSGGGGAAAVGAGLSSSLKQEVPALSPGDRLEHQRKKSKLLSMLDEVDRRYNHYCDQMQMVVNSFDSVMGFGAATPYTALAQKAMSRHFRCLKDAIGAQLRRTCELLGEKEAGGSGSCITKGETPRLRLLDQSLRQQRAFHQMGMMEQEAWRPQRGLPERSVNILRAWLFEHFLHPYPSDADKHLLARQTGLSRNQVSNWFINARVRLWKPMVEEMYQQEGKEREAAGAGGGGGGGSGGSTSPPPTNSQSPPPPPLHHINQDQQPHLHSTDTTTPSQRIFNSGSTVPSASTVGGVDDPLMDADELCRPHDNDDFYGEYGATGLGPAARMRLGAAGDVSLTLGLRHAGNAPEKNRFSVRDFGGC